MGQRHTSTNSHSDTQAHIDKYITRFHPYADALLTSIDYQRMIHAIITSFDAHMPDDLLLLIIEYMGFGGVWVSVPSSCTHDVDMRELKGIAYNPQRDECCSQLYDDTMQRYSVSDDSSMHLAATEPSGVRQTVVLR